MNSNNYIVIMAGGVGSRFWPSSREALPKQFLDITGIGRTLIQMTFERAKAIVPVENILISSNKKYKALILDQLPISDAQLLLEPSRNDTAPCIAYAALKIKSLNENACFAVLPSDHVIKKEELFVQLMDDAFAFATENESIVTLGIQPTRPDTGYGYIELARDTSSSHIKRVASFKEKPNLETAKEYLSTSNYLWNGGIFIWSIQTVLNAFEKNATQIINVLSTDISKYNTSEEQDYIDKVYPQTDKISVDYALLEKSKEVYTIPADIDWSDLGTWASLHSFLAADPKENVILAGNQIIKETSDCLVRTSKNKTVVINGLTDYIIIDEDDVLMIYPKSKEQEIKQLRSSISDESIL